MENNPSSEQKAFLTGMKPGQSWEDFVESLTGKLRERGFFAPEQNQPLQPDLSGEDQPKQQTEK